MNKTDFCREFSTRNNVTFENGTKICCEVFDFLTECLATESRVYIHGLGTFKKKTTAERKVGDLHNGGALKTIPAKTKVTFEYSPKKPPASQMVPAEEAVKQIIKLYGAEQFMRAMASVVATPEEKKVHICEHCGDTYIPKVGGQKYCSVECRTAHNVQRQVTLRDAAGAIREKNVPISRQGSGKSVTINL